MLDARPCASMTAAWVVLGVISFSNSSHFDEVPNSKSLKPVILPPGRARLSTSPLPTGSMIWTNTTGMVRVACRSAATTGVLLPTITSGLSATNSATCIAMRLASAAPKRYSTRTLRPSVHPNSCSPCRNA